MPALASAAQACSRPVPDLPAPAALPPLPLPSACNGVQRVVERPAAARHAAAAGPAAAPRGRGRLPCPLHCGPVGRVGGAPALHALGEWQWEWGGVGMKAATTGMCTQCRMHGGSWLPLHLIHSIPLCFLRGPPAGGLCGRGHGKGTVHSKAHPCRWVALTHTCLHGVGGNSHLSTAMRHVFDACCAHTVSFGPQGPALSSTWESTSRRAQMPSQ